MIRMNDGEEEILEQVLLSNSHDVTSEFQDSFLDQLLRNTQTCTHTHTCNPPGPDAVHTHTCYHSHTQVFTSEEDEDRPEKQHSKSRRPLGNREAVRKYREKKKARTAYLEEEVKKLSVLNQQLIRRLQGHTVLEAEVLRLRSLLHDIRGKIDSELGIFPFQKQCLKEEGCRVQALGCEGAGFQCETMLPCLHPQLGSSSHVGVGGSATAVAWDGNCEPPIAACQATANGSSERNLVDGTLAPTSASQTE